ncbi:AraC family transcriptional regulator [Shewanella sp.]|nr:AraC family transcriptional regulator [Shewanella sp.]
MFTHKTQTEMLYPITHIEILYRWLMTQGYDKSEIVKSSELASALFEDREEKISFIVLQDFILHSMELTGDECLGLKIGRFIGEQSSGLIGYAVKCAPTLVEALDILDKYFSLRSPLYSLETSRQNGDYYLYFKPAADFNSVTLFLNLMFLSAILSLLEQREQGLFAVRMAQLISSKPKNLTCVNSPKINLCFNASSNCIIFKREYLENTSYQSDVKSLIELEKIFEDQLQALPKADIVSQIKRQLILNGNQSPDQESIAKNLGLSARSFRRKLDALGLSYKDIVNEQRSAKAIRLLANTDLCLDEIAKKMGYSDVANFRRAFTHWTGKVFKDYRS